VYAPWRDKRILDVEEKLKAREPEGETVSCRICQTMYKRRHNEVLCRDCAPVCVAPMRFNAGLYTGVLVDENRKARAMIVSKYQNTLQCGLTLKAKENGFPVRWLIYKGVEIIEEVGL
jgi:hypothetical protein